MVWSAATLLLALVAAASATQTEAEREALRQVSEGSNAFSTALYGVLRSKPGNLIVSPMSAGAALGLVLQGAGGPTAQQLQTALRLPPDAQVQREGFKQLFASLQTTNEVIVRIANKVYTLTGAKIKAPFKSTAQDHFRADAQELDFARDTEGSRRTINAWVEQVTDNKIKDLLRQLDPATLMVIVNAIYFKGTWDKPFEESATRDEPFHTSPSTQVQVPMMHRTSRFRYAALPDLGARVLELPYRGHAMKMWVLLPDAVDGLARLEEGLGSLNLSSVSASMTHGEVVVSLPKFKIESTFQLHEKLPLLGITDLFQSNANLTGITDLSVLVSQVIQKAFVEVTEEGTVAAAATDGAEASLPEDRPPYCTVAAQCDQTKACLGGECRDPCPGICGLFATCKVVNHQPLCICMEGTTGDPFHQCNPLIEAPRGREPPNCDRDEDCPKSKACIYYKGRGLKCQDPCPGSCSLNATCKTVNHNPVCNCIEGTIGDPKVSCVEIPRDSQVECVFASNCDESQACVGNRCEEMCPKSCGLFAECYVHDHVAICRCPPGTFGDPFFKCVLRPDTHQVDMVREATKNCRLNSHCSRNQNCMQWKCQDPCPGFCGNGAKCAVHNHEPVCRCINGTAGDPMVNCISKDDAIAAVETPPEPECVHSGNCKESEVCVKNKCQGTCPFGYALNATCVINGHKPVCKCKNGTTGDPFYMCSEPYNLGSVECETKFDCAETETCGKWKCYDPCPGSCGRNASCTVENHRAVCNCPHAYTGNPYEQCTPVLQAGVACTLSVDCGLGQICVGGACLDGCPAACGPGAACFVFDHVPICSCPHGTAGDPFVACTPQPRESETTTNGSSNGTCTDDADCDPTESCRYSICQDLCVGKCKHSTRCQVRNKFRHCACLEGTAGDHTTLCTAIPEKEQSEYEDLCDPSQCGVSARCKNGECACPWGYQGDPRVECLENCLYSHNCDSTKDCINGSCQNPCPGHCGKNALCKPQVHYPVCSCGEGTTGNPLIECVPISGLETESIEENQEKDNGTKCSIDNDCDQTETCESGVCQDPCQLACGNNIECNVHNRTCEEFDETTRDPDEDNDISSGEPISTTDLSSPWVFQNNAQCQNGVCTCLDGYYGNPYEGCQPNCTSDCDCDRTLACFGNRCRDPCPGACGLNAKCDVIHHKPSCTCLPGTTGVPFIRCDYVVPSLASGELCLSPSCGANAGCNAQGACACLPGHDGAPPNCRRQCTVHSDCGQTEACISDVCENPCLDTCGPRAWCVVVNHVPKCACLPGTSGNPYVNCELQPMTSGNPICTSCPRVMVNRPFIFALTYEDGVIAYGKFVSPTD